ncbi:PRA1 family protein [Leishmania donovani]|nr:PRA1 family protein [Leishmania donovani]CAJ1992142.1 PRA1 family protein [Leishmania donovani]
MADFKPAKEDMIGKMSFVEGSAPSAGADASTDAATAHSASLAYPASDEPLPSYVSIIMSEISIAAKVQQLYHVSRQHVMRNFMALRPWSEFFDTTFFHSPSGVTDTVNRLNRNLPYFYANYLVLSLLCSSYILLINLPFAVYAVLMVTWYLFIRSRSAMVAALAAQGASEEEQMVYIANRAFTISQLYLMLIVFGVVGFYLTSGSSVIFWLLLTSFGVSVGHASMRRPPIQDSAFDLV